MLTEHFSEAEFGIVESIDSNTQRIISNARFLCREILEPIRKYIQEPITGSKCPCGWSRRFISSISE